MALNPTEPQTIAKPKGPIGAYRVEGGRFASFDAQGLTEIINEAKALALGIREV